MYYLTPFRYLLEGFLSVAVHGQPVQCADKEFAKFSPPPGQDCNSYASAFANQTGGYVQTGVNGLCEFCQYRTGDDFAATFNVYYKNKWEDYGVFWAYCGFNFMLVFICSWLVLGGWKTVKDKISPEARRQARARKAANERA